MAMKVGQKIRVVIIDDQEIVRIGVRAALENHGQIEIVAEGKTETEALHLASEYHPDVLLFGLNSITSEKSSSMALSVCNTIRGLLKTCQTNILVLCRYAHKVLIRAVIRAGASGIMLKDEAMNSCAILAQAIVDIARKKNLSLSQAIYERFYLHGLEIEDIPQLTDRRIEIMQTIADNPQMTLSQVAGLLGIAESTLRNNLSVISRALDTPSLNGAIIECLKLGIIQINQHALL